MWPPDLAPVEADHRGAKTLPAGCMQPYGGPAVRLSRMRRSRPAGSWTRVAGPGHAPTAQVVLDLLAHAVIPDR